jgi:hypothetical protein
MKAEGCPKYEALMAEYIVTTRRDLIRKGDDPPTALSAVSSFPGVKVAGYVDPNTVTIDTDAETAQKLGSALSETHYVEPVVHREIT